MKLKMLHEVDRRSATFSTEGKSIFTIDQ